MKSNVRYPRNLTERYHAERNAAGDTEAKHMTYPQWWEKNYADTGAGSTGADRTFGEEVWDKARKQVWSEVFQIVSDNPQMFHREAIKKLEAARGV